MLRGIVSMGLMLLLLATLWAVQPTALPMDEAALGGLSPSALAGYETSIGQLRSRVSRFADSTVDIGDLISAHIADRVAEGLAAGGSDLERVAVDTQYLGVGSVALLGICLTQLMVTRRRRY